MELDNLLRLQGMLFTLVAAGLVLRKLKILPEQAASVLTDLLIYLVLPCNIIQSFELKFNLQVLIGFLVILLISLAIQVGCLFLSSRLYNKIPVSQKKVLQYATVCSNAGFMGNPIAEGVFGAEGLMYASIFLIPQRIVMWSAGISYFTESPDRKTVIKKLAVHPCIIAVYIGLFLMITQLRLPGFLSDTIHSVGGCTTAVSMVLIGTILAKVDFRSVINRTTIYYTLIRLVLIPLLVFAACRLLSVDSLLTGVSVLLAGMPAGSTTAILAAKYQGDAVFAAKCVVFTTLMSLVTIPLWCLIL